MGFSEELIQQLNRALEIKFDGVQRKMAEAAGWDPTGLGRVLKGKRTTWLDTMGRLADAAGLKIVLSGEGPKPDLTRDVCWVDATIVPAGEKAGRPEAEDYFAVPLVGEAGAGPGVVSEDAVKSWILVYKNQRAIKGHTDMLAVEIERRSTSMVPTLHPRDIVLVDRNDIEITKPGGIYLVREPGQTGGGKVKRVQLTKRKDETLVVYYSDNQEENPPEVYSLQADFNDRLSDAIIGRVVWAWSDMTRK
ncbi:S24 family peptidase [Desulfocurvibacter africanus]|nr:S24 family peptidase [Desulfocurvibacter africanus]